MMFNKVFLGLLFITLLVGCSPSDDRVADGIGGTGISMGRITGFGSVIVNGVKFETDSSAFTRDRESGKLQQDFNPGEFVFVRGDINDDKTTGVAQEVIFSDVIEGPITDIHDNSLEILSQTVNLNSTTLFNGVQRDGLQVGNSVEVSGFMQPNGEIDAAAINFIKPILQLGDSLELEGDISGLDTGNKTFSINTLSVDYSSALFENISEEQLSDGLHITIVSDQVPVNNVLIAKTLIIEEQLAIAGIDLELAGRISEVSSNTVVVNGIDVVISDNTQFINGGLSDLVENVDVKISGTMNANNQLEATAIDAFIFDSEITLAGFIQSVDREALTLELFNQTFGVSHLTLYQDITEGGLPTFNFDDLVVGDFVRVVGVTKDSANTAVLISKEEPQQEFSFRAVVNALSLETTTLELSLLDIVLDESLILYDSSDHVLSVNSFVKLLEVGKSTVEVKGRFKGTLFIVTAIRLAAEDPQLFFDNRNDSNNSR